MRVLVCGGRDYKNRQAVFYELDHIGPPHVSEVISGMATGADSIAAEWARRFCFPLHEFPADWHTYGRAAGPIRNRQMLDEGKPDLVLAFPGGRGTANMVKQAKERGIEVREVRP